MTASTPDKHDPFVVKDSGKRSEFDSGMVRDTNDDKVLSHLVFDGPMLKRWEIHLTKGAAKYSPGNWLQATGKAELDRFRESAVRHFFQWLRGETDEDHAAAVFFNINGVEYLYDRFRADARLLKEMVTNTTYDFKIIEWPTTGCVSPASETLGHVVHQGTKVPIKDQPLDVVRCGCGLQHTNYKAS